jgi:tRNA threonylcarbamoyladenosine biosynthesis protein TsaE
MSKGFSSRSADETHEFGKQIGELVQPADIILLSGPLGAGKTCLTQGIAWGLGIQEYTASPSFVLVRELYGRLPLYHIDLYRLDHLEEIAELGLDEYLYGKGVTVIEWAEKAEHLLPPEHLHIRIEYIAENERRFYLEPQGKRYVAMVAALKSKLKLKEL